MYILCNFKICACKNCIHTSIQLWICTYMYFLSQYIYLLIYMSILSIFITCMHCHLNTFFLRFFIVGVLHLNFLCSSWLSNAHTEADSHWLGRKGTKTAIKMRRCHLRSWEKEGCALNHIPPNRQTVYDLCWQRGGGKGGGGQASWPGRGDVKYGGSTHKGYYRRYTLNYGGRY